jgi:enediyne biosynthesis protein E4
VGLALAWLATGQFATTQSPANVQFVNVAAQSGIDFQHVSGASPDRHLYEIMSGGGLFFDYDKDGWLDVFLVDGGSLTNPVTDKTARHRLYRNRGNGTFQDVTASSGIAHNGYGMGACAADVNNDGWIDLYVTSVGVNTLYQNNGARPASPKPGEGGDFTDVTKTAGVAGASMFSASCAFADVDRDGDVDLFVVNYVDARVDNNTFCGDVGRKFRIYCHPLTFAALRNTLYRNNGSGVFTDVSKETGILEHRGNGLGVVFGDYDDDGWVDAFVANDSTPNFLFHNDAGRRFTETALLAGVSVASDGMPRAGMGTDFGDYDGDGDLDLFVSNHELEAHTLFRNLGKGLFEDATFPSGVGPATLPYVGFGAAFVDYDNDADLDLGIVNGHVMNSPGHVRPGATEAQRKLLLRNGGGGRLTDVARQSGSGFGSEKVGRTLSAGDFDNDGDLDLLVTNNGGNAELLRNEGGTGNNSVLIQLVGVKSNRSAAGARLRLMAGGTTQVREIKAGSSYLGQNDLRVHVGLGKATTIDRLEVRWPNGQNEVIDGAAVNQIVTVTEAKGITARAPFVRK